MPTRVIRSQINSSESLAQVSMKAELTFDRLLLAVDDYGRLDARADFLKSVLFPIRARATPARVLSWVQELASIDDPPVRLYEVAGRPYLEMVNWEGHRSSSKRSQKSRYPANPRESPGDPGDPGKSARLTSDVCRVSSDVKNTARSKHRAARASNSSPPGFGRWWKVYADVIRPRPMRDKKQCAAEWRSKHLEQYVDAMIQKLEAQRAYRDDAKADREFVPLLPDPIRYLRRKLWKEEIPT